MLEYNIYPEKKRPNEDLKAISAKARDYYHNYFFCPINSNQEKVYLNLRYENWTQDNIKYYHRVFDHQNYNLCPFYISEIKLEVEAKQLTSEFCMFIFITHLENMLIYMYSRMEAEFNLICRRYIRANPYPIISMDNTEYYVDNQRVTAYSLIRLEVNITRFKLIYKVYLEFIKLKFETENTETDCESTIG